MMAIVYQEAKEIGERLINTTKMRDEYFDDLPRRLKLVEYRQKHIEYTVKELIRQDNLKGKRK